MVSEMGNKKTTGLSAPMAERKRRNYKYLLLVVKRNIVITTL
jgi:hypothetical protein